MKFRLFIVCVFFASSLSSKPFVTADMKGRLGNHLFIIAAAVSLALDNDATATFPSVVQNRNYKNVYPRINVNILNRNISTTYREPRYNYTPIPYTADMKISGFFQSEKYFKHHKNEIIELFLPSKKILDYLTSKYSDVITNPKTVAIHVRCYEKENPFLAKRYPCYKGDYFFKVMSQFPEDFLFVIFSDNINWCKKEFANCGYKIKFIENELDYHDFYLMSLFKHMIISNSSFSWWAAYINQNPDKVIIAPPKWFYGGDDKDVIPEDWIIFE